MTLVDNPTRSKIKKIHFIGIGGSGMSGIAEVLVNLGYEISGSDIQSNTATEKLEKLGCSISYKQVAANVLGKQAVVVSSAIEKNNLELQYRGRIRELKDHKPVTTGDSELRIAMKLVATSGKGPAKQTPSMGCNIKWFD